MEQVGNIILIVSSCVILFVLLAALVMITLAMCANLATYIFDRIRRSYVEYKTTQYIMPEDPYPDYELTEMEDEHKWTK